MTRNLISSIRENALVQKHPAHDRSTTNSRLLAERVVLHEEDFTGEGFRCLGPKE
jgi:hypothetical protein